MKTTICDMSPFQRFVRILTILHVKCVQLEVAHGYLWMTNMYSTGFRMREHHNRYAAMLNRRRRKNIFTALLFRPISYIRNPMTTIAALEAQQQQPRPCRGQ